MPDRKSQENSPLEIYETAYRLHYIDNRIAEAIKYYEILIKEFPDSNECGYAAVQIQKIRANGLADLLNYSAKSIHPVAVTALVLSVLSILLLASVSYYFYSRYKQEQNRTKLVLTALSKVYIGDDTEALRVLTELKIKGKNDILPFELSSDLYKKNGLHEQARSEYEIFFRLNPAVKPSSLQLSKMKPPLKEPDIAESTSFVQAKIPAAENRKISHQKNGSPVPSRDSVSNVKPQKKRLPQPERKPVKGIFLVDPDSLSFF